MNKIIFVFTLFLALANSLYGQNKITGTITDDQGNPVLGADIYIEQLHIGTTSDESGYFELVNVPLGSHQLSISFIGFSTENLAVDLGSEALSLEISLHPTVFHMDEVIVSAPFSRLQSENVMKIESRSIETLKKAGAPTLMQGISNIPGVSEITTGTGIGKPVIRGLSGNRVLVYTQGVRLENQQFGSEHGLGMNESGIDNVEVIKGPASLLYGSDALGGVLYLTPEKFAYQNETEVNLNQSFFSNTLGSNTSLGVKTSGQKFKFIARGGLNSHVDYMIPDGSRVTNTRFNEKDFKAGIGLNLDQFVTEFRYNYNNAQIGIPDELIEESTDRSPENPYQDLQTHILSLHNHLFFKESKIDLNIGFISNIRKEFEDHHDHGEDHEEEEDHHEEEEEHDEEEGAALNMKLNTFSYDLKYHFPKQQKLELIAGIQGMSQVNRNYGEELLIPDAKTNDFGALATGILEINDQQYLQGGIRFDYRNISTETYTIEPHDADEVETIVPGIDRNYSNFTFSAGHRGQFFKVLTTRLNFASGFRAPNLAELSSYGVHHGSNRFEIGNPDLVSEQNFQTDLSLEYTNKHIEIYANGFYNNMNNYIYSNPTGETIEDVQVFEYVQNDAELYGGEFGFHLHPHPYDWLHLESAYEMVVGKLKNGDYLPLIPANKWSNTIRGEFNGNDRLHGIYIAMLLDSYFSQDKVSEFEDPTDAYNLFHIRMGGTLEFNKVDMGINLSLNNLFDTEYISHLSALKSDLIPNPGRNIVLGLNFDF